MRKQVCLRTTAPYPGGGRRCPEEDLWHCAVVSSFSSSERGMCTSAPPTHLDDNSHQCHSSVRTATFIFEALIELHLYKMTRFFYTSMKMPNFHILAGSPLSRSTNESDGNYLSYIVLLSTGSSTKSSVCCKHTGVTSKSKLVCGIIRGNC